MSLSGANDDCPYGRVEHNRDDRSLAIGTGEHIAPSLAVLVKRNGPMEITALVVVVVATRSVIALASEVRSPVTGGIRSGTIAQRLVNTHCEGALLIGGYLLLAVGCYREAIAIAQIADEEGVIA